jgi:hypothetical protein
MALPQVSADLRKYLPFLLLVLILWIVYAFLIPDGPKQGPYRTTVIIASLIFGSLVGASEIASRYRDEPLKAVVSPFGLTYLALNGYFSVLAVFIIVHFHDSFPKIADDPLLTAITAGFGASIVMRTRIAVLRGPDGKDVSVGPDYVISILLQVVDTNIDRWRAVKRQEILSIYIATIRSLGDFPSAWRYLLASLLAFQNLDDARKKTLSDTFNDYQAQGDKLPEDIKRLGLGFLFLTLVGESNFSSVLENAKSLQARVATGAVSAASSTPVTPAGTPTAGPTVTPPTSGSGGPGTTNP